MTRHSSGFRRMSPWIESTMSLSRPSGREKVMLLQILDRLTDVHLREIFLVAKQNRSQPGDI